MDDLDKIDKYEWYGLGGGYWDAGELIDPDDNPEDYIESHGSWQTRESLRFWHSLRPFCSWPE